MQSELHVSSSMPRRSASMPRNFCASANWPFRHARRAAARRRSGAAAGRGSHRGPARAQGMGPRRGAMDSAAQPAQPMVPGTRTAAHHRRRPPASRRATLPRRVRLQGHQGQAGEAGGQKLAQRGPAGTARQARARAALTAQWPDARKLPTRPATRRTSPCASRSSTM